MRNKNSIDKYSMGEITYEKYLHEFSLLEKLQEDEKQSYRIQNSDLLNSSDFITKNHDSKEAFIPTNELTITVLLMGNDKTSHCACCEGSHHIAAIIDDLDTIKTEGHITKNGRYVVNFGFYDNELGTGSDLSKSRIGLIDRLEKRYPVDLRVQFKVPKSEKNNIKAFSDFYKKAGYFPFDKAQLNIYNNCSRAVYVTLNYFVKEPTERLVKRAASKSIFGLFSCCSGMGYCTKCFPTGPFFTSPDEVYKQALAIAIGTKKTSGPKKETMRDEEIIPAKQNDEERYRRGCIW